MKQRRLLFAPYLVPPTPRCGDCSWKAFMEEREGKKRLQYGKDLGWRRWEETLLYGVQRFIPGEIWDSRGWGAIPPLTVCLPVRMGTVSACNWMPVLALWSGWSLHCGTASEWHSKGDVILGRFIFLFEGGLCVVSLRMNASKKFCLSWLILSAVERSRGVV